MGAKNNFGLWNTLLGFGKGGLQLMLAILQLLREHSENHSNSQHESDQDTAYDQDGRLG